MNFDKIVDRRQSLSLRWHAYPQDVLPLWVADMDFQSPPEVIAALHGRVEHGIFGYDLPPTDLAGIITERMRRLYAWQLAEEQIAYVPGIVTGFNLGVRAFCQPGDAVIIQTPAYPPFFSAPRSANMLCVENPMLRDSDNRYTIDFDRFETQIVEHQVKVFIHCNPHNPSGRVFTREELTRLAEICLRHGVLICSDEIHCDILYDGHQHIPIASLSPEVAAITVTFMAPSKTFNVAGLDASVMICQNAELAEKLCAARQGLVGNPNLLGLTAFKAAYLHGGPWLEELLVYLQANRDWLRQTLAEKLPAVRMSVPEGTFLAWLDCSGLGLEGSQQKFFLEKAKVGLNEGLDYGCNGEGFVRLNFGTPRANLVEALARMCSALDEAR